MFLGIYQWITIKRTRQVD